MRQGKGLRQRAGPLFAAVAMVSAMLAWGPSVVPASGVPNQECGDPGRGGGSGGANDPDTTVYDPNCGGPSENGNGGGGAGGRPDAGEVGNADDKDPRGQLPGPNERNRGYECDGNNGVAQGNPAHTGCLVAPTTTSPGQQPTTTLGQTTTTSPGQQPTTTLGQTTTTSPGQQQPTTTVAAPSTPTTVTSGPGGGGGASAPPAVAAAAPVVFDVAGHELMQVTLCDATCTQ